MRARWASAFASVFLLASGFLGAAPVAVRHVEGVVRGFLVLCTLEGVPIADGDLIQVARGDRVTSRVVFRFKDGSLHEETVVFSQKGQFRLVSDHLIQKGPSFPHPMETTVDAASGRVTVRYQEDGKEKFLEEKMELPEDVSNGLMFPLLKNVGTQASTAVSMVAASPKPRLVQLVITPAGEDSFSVGSTSHKATRYVVKVELGGLAGVIAPLIGKKPTDTHVWILNGEAPAFVRSEGALYFGGPIWRIDLDCPAWARASSPAPKR
jgi:hypothetical protein